MSSESKGEWPLPAKDVSQELQLVLQHLDFMMERKLGETAKTLVRGQHGLRQVFEFLTHTDLAKLAQAFGPLYPSQAKTIGIYRSIGGKRLRRDVTVIQPTRLTTLACFFNFMSSYSVRNVRDLDMHRLYLSTFGHRIRHLSLHNASGLMLARHEQSNKYLLDDMKRVTSLKWTIGEEDYRDKWGDIDERWRLWARVFSLPLSKFYARVPNVEWYELEQSMTDVISHDKAPQDVKGTVVKWDLTHFDYLPSTDDTVSPFIVGAPMESLLSFADRHRRLVHLHLQVNWTTKGLFQILQTCSKLQSCGLFARWPMVFPWQANPEQRPQWPTEKEIGQLITDYPQLDRLRIVNSQPDQHRIGIGFFEWSRYPTEIDTSVFLRHPSRLSKAPSIATDVYPLKWILSLRQDLYCMAIGNEFSIDDAKALQSVTKPPSIGHLHIHYIKASDFKHELSWMMENIVDHMRLGMGTSDYEIAATCDLKDGKRFEVKYAEFPSTLSALRQAAEVALENLFAPLPKWTPSSSSLSSSSAVEHKHRMSDIETKSSTSAKHTRRAEQDLSQLAKQYPQQKEWQWPEGDEWLDLLDDSVFETSWECHSMHATGHFSRTLSRLATALDRSDTGTISMHSSEPGAKIKKLRIEHGRVQTQNDKRVQRLLDQLMTIVRRARVV